MVRGMVQQVSLVHHPDLHNYGPHDYHTFNSLVWPLHFKPAGTVYKRQTGSDAGIHIDPAISANWTNIFRLLIATPPKEWKIPFQITREMGEWKTPAQIAQIAAASAIAKNNAILCKACTFGEFRQRTVIHCKTGLQTVGSKTGYLWSAVEARQEWEVPAMKGPTQP